MWVYFRPRRTTKNEAERRQTKMQSQIITASLQNTNASGVSVSGRANEPFVTHKLNIGKERITSDEDFTVIDDWIKELHTDIEIIMPGSKRIMQEAKANIKPVTESTLMTHRAGKMATTLSRELFVIITKKTAPNNKAKFELNGLTENLGLEALRRFRMNLCKRKGPRLQDEYEASTTLPKVKESEMNGLQSRLGRWESEIKKIPGIGCGICPWCVSEAKHGVSGTAGIMSKGDRQRSG